MGQFHSSNPEAEDALNDIRERAAGKRMASDPMNIYEAIRTADPKIVTKVLDNDTGTDLPLMLAPGLSVCTDIKNRKCGSYGCVFESEATYGTKDGKLAVRVAYLYYTTGFKRWTEPWQNVVVNSLMNGLMRQEIVPPFFVKTHSIVVASPENIAKVGVPKTCGADVFLYRMVMTLRTYAVNTARDEAIAIWDVFAPALIDLHRSQWGQPGGVANISAALQYTGPGMSDILTADPLFDQQTMRSVTPKVEKDRIAWLKANVPMMLNSKFNNLFVWFYGQVLPQVKWGKSDYYRSTMRLIEQSAMGPLPWMTFTVMDKAPRPLLPVLGLNGVEAADVGERMKADEKAVCFFMVASALFSAQNAACFHHNDLSSNNVMARRPRAGEMYRGQRLDYGHTGVMIRLQEYRVILPYANWLPAVIDYDRAAFETYAGEVWIAPYGEGNPDKPGSVAIDLAALIRVIVADKRAPAFGLGWDTDPNAKPKTKSGERVSFQKLHHRLTHPPAGIEILQDARWTQHRIPTYEPYLRDSLLVGWLLDCIRERFKDGQWDIIPPGHDPKQYVENDKWAGSVLDLTYDPR